MRATSTHLTYPLVGSFAVNQSHSLMNVSAVYVFASLSADFAVIRDGPAEVTAVAAEVEGRGDGALFWAKAPAASRAPARRCREGMMVSEKIVKCQEGREVVRRRFGEVGVSFSRRSCQSLQAIVCSLDVEEEFSDSGEERQGQR